MSLLPHFSILSLNTSYVPSLNYFFYVFSTSICIGNPRGYFKRIFWFRRSEVVPEMLTFDLTLRYCWHICTSKELVFVTHVRVETWSVLFSTIFPVPRWCLPSTRCSFSLLSIISSQGLPAHDIKISSLLRIIKMKERSQTKFTATRHLKQTDPIPSETFDRCEPLMWKMCGGTLILVKVIKDGCQFHQPIANLPTHPCFHVSCVGVQDVLPDKD